MQDNNTTYWTCQRCGARVPYGELHACGERAQIHPQAAAVWALADPPPDTRGWRLPLDPQERMALALERIARALEKLLVYKETKDGPGNSR